MPFPISSRQHANLTRFLSATKQARFSQVPVIGTAINFKPKTEKGKPSLEKTTVKQGKAKLSLKEAFGSHSPSSSKPDDETKGPIASTSSAVQVEASGPSCEKSSSKQVLRCDLSWKGASESLRPSTSKSDTEPKVQVAPRSSAVPVEGSHRDDPSDDGLLGRKECKVCRRSYREIVLNEEDLVTLSCGHVCCSQCVLNITSLSSRSKCLYCRQSLE